MMVQTCEVKSAEMVTMYRLFSSTKWRKRAQLIRIKTIYFIP